MISCDNNNYFDCRCGCSLVPRPHEATRDEASVVATRNAKRLTCVTCMRDVCRLRLSTKARRCGRNVSIVTCPFF